MRDGAAGPLRADGVPQGLAAPSAGVRAAPHGLATVDDIVPGGCGTTVERERSIDQLKKEYEGPLVRMHDQKWYDAILSCLSFPLYISLPLRAHLRDVPIRANRH